MKEVMTFYEALAETKRLGMVAMTIDPGHDGPEWWGWYCDPEWDDSTQEWLATPEDDEEFIGLLTFPFRFIGDKEGVDIPNYHISKWEV